MTEEDFKNLILELIEENPFAIRAVLKILSVEFSNKVPTMAVTREERPRLLVNLDFVNQHCSNDMQVKAVICHEFLHILLRHTENLEHLTDAMHLAMDAVINSIIDRQLGEEYSAMMSNYYKEARGLHKLLRPPNDEDFETWEESVGFPYEAWDGLYNGTLIVDDIAELAERQLDDQTSKPTSDTSRLLGNHEDLGEPIPEILQDALGRSLKAMNGSGIWRSPKGRGIGTAGYETVVTEQDIALDHWKKSTLAVFKKHLIPNQLGKLVNCGTLEYHIPVLSSADRRAFIRTLWSPFIPDSSWKTVKKQPGGQAQIYLDVSGSMNAEMPFIIALLNRLKTYIKSPFWAFSTEVAPARIESGQLITNTTGGTSLACVLEHIAQTKPDSAVIVTDGYIEAIQPREVALTKPTRIHAIISRDGSTKLLDDARIPFTQLERIP